MGRARIGGPVRLDGKNVLITGGASGIGAALARRFAAEGAASIGIADLDLPAAQAFADSLASDGLHKTMALEVDVARAEAVGAMVSDFENGLGPIDVVCSNAGVFQPVGTADTDRSWELNWSVNVMGNVHVARAVLPGMLRRGSGHLLLTCSGAGLLANMDAPYMVSKHAAVAYAEWLAIQYRGKGIGVSALCPLGVRTPLITRAIEQKTAALAGVLAGGDLIEPEVVAQCAVEGLMAGKFLILPHEAVRDRMVSKALDRDAWIASMQRQYGLDSEAASSDAGREGFQT